MEIRESFFFITVLCHLIIKQIIIKKHDLELKMFLFKKIHQSFLIDLPLCCCPEVLKSNTALCPRPLSLMIMMIDERLTAASCCLCDDGRTASPVQPLTCHLVATGRRGHHPDVSSRRRHHHYHLVGMATLHLVVSPCPAVPRDSVPGCTSPPVAATAPRPAAP